MHILDLTCWLLRFNTGSWFSIPRKACYVICGLHTILGKPDKLFTFHTNKMSLPVLMFSFFKRFRGRNMGSSFLSILCRVFFVWTYLIWMFRAASNLFSQMEYYKVVEPVDDRPGNVSDVREYQGKIVGIIYKKSKQKNNSSSFFIFVF